jgi:hypothetical protein
MVKRSQLSAEFIVSILLFLTAMIMIFSALIRTYIDYSENYYTENVHITAERYLQTLISKDAQPDWVNDPYSAADISFGSNGTLNYTFVKTIGAMNYPHVRNLIEADDFKLEVRYLPSLTISPTYYQTYPEGDVTINSVVSDLDGNPMNATVYGVLIPAQGLASVKPSSYGYGKHFWAFNNVTAGHYRVNLIAFNDIQYGITEFEVDVL